MIEIQLPRGGRVRAALFGLLMAGALWQIPSPAAAEATNFNGPLDYTAFKRASERNETVRITYSPGGTGAAALALAKTKVIIDGQCNSACAWSFVKNENACFTSRAVFGFHAAHDPGTGRRMNAATTYWLSTVRTSLRGRLSPLLATSSLINIPASQMRAYYGDRACGAPQPKAEVAATSQVSKPSKQVRSARADETMKSRAAVKKPQQTGDGTVDLQALVVARTILEAPASTSAPENAATSRPSVTVPDVVFASLDEPVADIRKAVDMLEPFDVPSDDFDGLKSSIVDAARALLPTAEAPGTHLDGLQIAAREEDVSFEGRHVVNASKADAHDATNATWPGLMVSAMGTRDAPLPTPDRVTFAALLTQAPKVSEEEEQTRSTAVDLGLVSDGRCETPMRHADAGHETSG